MKRKKSYWFGILLSLAIAFTAIPMAALAGNEGQTIDFNTFLQEVAASGYNYDGQGVTVEWSPSSACTDSRPGHDCLFEGEAPQADGNNPQRGQVPNAQYQIFGDQTDVTIQNVNFKFDPADFTICMNSGWKGSYTADQVRNAELQMLNTGAVSFIGCNFDGVIVSPFNSSTSTYIEGCNFSNVYDAYAVKDVYSPNATITGCTFTNCGGGVYFEYRLGDTPRDIVIEGNTFTDIDTNAAANKVNTRGLIQFSANGDYSNSTVTISGNSSTGGAAAIRQLNNTLTADVLDLDVVEESNQFAGEMLTDSTFGSNTVYYNGSCYATLADALKAVYMSSPETTAKVYCKPGADVGTLTHGHVSDDIIIYGNGATVSGGEGDLEIDTYKYDRATGKNLGGGSDLTKDITVKVMDLNGIAAWGQRNSDYTVNLIFENCQNMDRIYFTNTANPDGKINISVTGCSFDANNGSNANTAVYSNAAGDITITGTTFKDIAVGLNINHKSSGVQNITLDGCTFEDCALSDSAQAASTKTYGAPVRVVAKQGATTNLVIRGTEFKYSDGKVNCGNGDILIGDGRYDAAEIQGIVTLGMSGTKADVVVQQKGYYAADGTVADASKSVLTPVTQDDEVLPDEGTHFVIDKHDQVKVDKAKEATCTEDGYTGDTVCKVCGKLVQEGSVIPALGHTGEVQGVKEATCTEAGYTGDTVCTRCNVVLQQGSEIPALGHTITLQGAKDATCTAEGYTGDKVCTRCNEVIEKGTAIAKLAHQFENGKCTLCGAVDSNGATGGSGTDKNDSPKTGDSSNAVVGITLLLVSAAGAVGILTYSRKKRQVR